MVKKIAITCLCLVAAFQVSRADQITVDIDSGSSSLFNSGSTLLTAGSAVVNGDGAVLQLGYFTGANFTGTWTPLTGQGGANSAWNTTSIGDYVIEGGVAGKFFIPGLTFVAGSGTSGNSLPINGKQLALRFYDGTSIATSTFYNTVMAPSWKWKDPASPPSVNVTMSLADPGLVWESIFAQGQATTTAFHTSILIAIPEPSSLALIGMALAGAPLAYLRRRRQS